MANDRTPDRDQHDHRAADPGPRDTTDDPLGRGIADDIRGIVDDEDLDDGDDELEDDEEGDEY